MNQRRRLLITIALLLLPLIFSTVSAQDDVKRLVTNSPAGDPHSIDPQQAIDTKDWNLENILFPAMTTFDEESHTVVGGLAESWDISSDGLVYTFHLVKNVPWVHYNADSDAVEQVMDDSGNPRYVTAQDVIYGLTRALDPAVASPGSYILVPLVQGAAEFNAGTGTADALGLKAIDDSTLEITAPEAVGYGLGIFGIIDARPTPQWAIDASGDAWTEPENINTYGPFALKEWVHDDHLTYVKNPFWPGSPGISQPKLDELDIRFLDDSVALREYEAGNLDTLQPVASDQYDRVSTDSALSAELKVVPGQCTTVWGFHTERPPFDNVHIRRAFSYAVDRESLVNNVMKGGRIPARWYTPPSIAFAPTLENNPDLGIAFDPDKAKAELALGLTDLGLSSAADLPAITAIFGNSEGNNAVGQALQVMWTSTLGVTVTLNPLDPTTYWSIVGSGPEQIFAAGWCPDYNDANNYTRDVMYSTGIYNYGKWNNPEFDKLVDQARTSRDDAERLSLYAQAEQIEVVDDAADMPLVWESIASLTKPYVIRTFSSNNVESYWKWDIQPH